MTVFDQGQRQRYGERVHRMTRQASTSHREAPTMTASTRPDFRTVDLSRREVRIAIAHQCTDDNLPEWALALNETADAHTPESLRAMWRGFVAEYRKTGDPNSIARAVVCEEVAARITEHAGPALTVSPANRACAAEAAQTSGTGRRPYNDARTTKRFTGIESGHYAIENADNSLSFYKVDVPEHGRWAGFRFVVAVEGDHHRRLDRASQTEALTAIAADPHAAMVRYGREIGRCGACNRRLTDEVSIAEGMGPECRKSRKAV